MATPVLPPPPTGPALARWLQQLWSSVSRVRLASGSPTITYGAGAPAGDEPDGSLYLRTDGIGTGLYVRQEGAWVAK